MTVHVYDFLFAPYSGYDCKKETVQIETKQANKQSLTDRQTDLVVTGV